LEWMESNHQTGSIRLISLSVRAYVPLPIHSNKNKKPSQCWLGFLQKLYILKQIT